MLKRLIIGAAIFDAFAAAGVVGLIWLQRGTADNLITFSQIAASAVEQSGIRECRGALDTLKGQVGLIYIDERILISILALLVLGLLCKGIALVRATR